MLICRFVLSQDERWLPDGDLCQTIARRPHWRNSLFGIALDVKTSATSSSVEAAARFAEGQYNDLHGKVIDQCTPFEVRYLEDT